MHDRALPARRGFIGISCVIKISSIISHFGKQEMVMRLVPRGFLGRLAGTVLITALSATTLHAAVTEADWQTPGDRLLTVDSVNNLAWLDLTVTRGMSFNAVLAQTAAGGAYAGFRIPRLSDLGSLYRQAVGPFAENANGNTPISDFTPAERAAQRAFVDRIGVTGTYDFSSFPGYGVRRDAVGLLRTSPYEPGLLAAGYFFYFDDVALSYSWFNNGYTNSGDYVDSITGVYLVRNLAGAVPEASAWAMMIAGFGLVGGVLRRRSQGDRRFVG
jgi:hypothetical protein